MGEIVATDERGSKLEDGIFRVGLSAASAELVALPDFV